MLGLCGVRRLQQAFAVFLLLASANAIADLQKDVYRFLAERNFSEADSRVEKALEASAHGSGPAREEIRALSYLLDSAFMQDRVTEASTGASIDRGLELSNADGEARGWRAKFLAARGLRQMLMATDTGTLSRAREDSASSIQVMNSSIGLNNIDRAFAYAAATAVGINDGDLQKAETLMGQAVGQVREAKSPYEKYMLALYLSRLGSLQQQVRHIDESKSNLKEALALARHLAGGQSVLYAKVLTQQGIVEEFGGDLARAVSTLELSLKILASDQHERQTRALATIYLGGALVGLGNYDQARTVLKEGVALCAGDATRLLPLALNNLGFVEKKTGHLDVAADLYHQVIHIKEQRSGPNSPVLGPPLVNLAILLKDTGDINGAEEALNRAIQVSPKSTHGLEGSSMELRIKGEIALARGQNDRAAQLFSQSIEELSESERATSPTAAGTLCWQATAEARAGHYEHAFRLALDGEQLRVQLLRRILPALTGRRSVDFKATWNGCAGIVVPLAFRLQNTNPEAVAGAWAVVAGARQLGTRLEAARIASIRDGPSGTRKAELTRWQLAAEHYADAVLKNMSSQDVNSAKESYDDAERSLSAKEYSTATFDLGELSRRLPHGAVLAAYTEVEEPDLSSGAKTITQSTHGLYVFIGEGASARLVSLGHSEDVGKRIEEWTELLHDPSSSLAEINSAGSKVREAVWDPLDLGNASHLVLVVPSGALYGVNMDALPDSKGAFLVEAGWQAHVLETEADITIANSDRQDKGQLLLVGLSEFGPVSSMTDESDGCPNAFTSLPGVSFEVASIADIWHSAVGGEPRRLIDNRATKVAVSKNMQSAQWIHLATHSIGGVHCRHSNPIRGIALQNAATAPAPDPGIGALAVAQANTYFTRGSTTGLLTSEEIATLDLSRAQWVVLSACSTGTGKITGDEGVFGLRRAFRVAGAHTLIVSLWQVDDSSTKEWMEELYQARLSKGQSTWESVASAELAMLAERRAAGRSAHPFYWASFVASGDWN